MKLPVRVAELDLAWPLVPLRGLDGVGAVRLLVRTGHLPVGWLTVATKGRDALDTDGLLCALHVQAGGSLRSAMLRRQLGLAVSNPLTDAAPPVSVVVCTRDRTESLERCLSSLRDLEYPHFEIIVVDNAPSSAATAELVAAMAPSFRAPRPLRYVREDRPGLDWARNRGVMESSYELVAFTDDDVRVDRAWLAGLARAFADPDVMMVTGLVAPAELDTQAQLLFEDGYAGMGKGFFPVRWQGDSLSAEKLLGAHHVGVGANMAFRRGLLRQLGGFDTALDVGTPAHGAGDIEMFHRVLCSGAVAQYEPSALVWHSHRRDHRSLARQLRDNGRGFGVYLLSCARRRTLPRSAVARYAVRIWLGWLVGRLIRSMLGRDALPVSLRAAEIAGALQSPFAYWATRRSNRRIRASLERRTT